MSTNARYACFNYVIIIEIKYDYEGIALLFETDVNLMGLERGKKKNTK